MNLQRSAVAGGCTLAAAAMCLDMDQRDLIAKIGHDGQDVWFPLRDGCARLRGFHMQEIVDVAFSLGWAVIQFDARPTITNGDAPIRQLWPDLRFVDSRMERLLSSVDRGMILGRKNLLRHAVAWDGERYYDPNGGIYRLSPISCECLFAFQRICSP